MRNGGQPPGPLDAVVALAVLPALAWASTAVVSRLSEGTWNPGAEHALGPALVGTTLANLAVVAFAWARAGGAGLGLVPPSRRRFLVFSVLALAPILALEVGWTVLLRALGLDPVEQEVLGLVRGRLGSPTGAALVFWAVVIVPALEEPIFRGFLLPILERRLGAVAAVLGTALLFGVLHGADPFAVPPVVVLGLVLGWLRVRSGSLYPPLLLHALNNAAAIGLQ